ncbi:MAG TPA: MFS transporter [Pseudonocardiaceae bacterium]|jgi:MFS family permease|nr:MFS transporter [Pseudonocardiaceae bacterium]
MADNPDRPAGFGAVLGVAEFRALFAAYTISVAGDQFARVALSVLVYDRTGSAGLTALTYALTFLPDLFGGPLLSGLADRYPRRRVMISGDAARTVLVALMAIPGEPLALVATLLVIVQLIGSPATAARAAITPQLLGEEAYPVGQAVLNTANQAAQVLGFAGGGALIAGIGADGVLLADAATFAASALLVAIGVRNPGRPGQVAEARAAWWPQLRGGAVLVWSDRRLRALICFACLSGLYIACEALAAPYAADLHGGPTLVGLLFAGFALGAAVGMLVLARLPARVRLRLMPVLAVGSCLVLIGCFARPGAVLTITLFAVSGLASSYQVTASTSFVRAVPDGRRGQAFGLAVTAMKVAQGLGVSLAGLAGERIAAHQVVAAAGLLGVIAALGVAWLWQVANRPLPPGAPATAPGGQWPARARENP